MFSRRWARELPKPNGVRWGEFRRGFIDTVYLSISTYTDQSGMTVRVVDTADQVFGYSPLQVIGFKWYRIEDVRDFLRWPGLTRFRVVKHMGHRWGAYRGEHESLMRELIQHDWGATPDLVDLRNYLFGDGPVSELLSVPIGRTLPRIDLRNNPISADLRGELTAKFGDRVLV